MVRHNNQLPDNLTQLQNLIKRDPESYKDEFNQQLAHFETTLEIFGHNPTQHNKKLEDHAMFLAQISHCYLEQLKNFPQRIIDVLKSNSTIMHQEMRLSLCKCLILLRNKKLITPFDLLELFFHLTKCQDKVLRDFLKNHMVNDIKNINQKSRDAKLNSTLQNFMFSMLDSNAKTCKLALDILIELYEKNIWKDTKTVNFIADYGCFSKITKVMVAALKFFLGRDPEETKDTDSEDEIDPKDTMTANKFNKKTRKRGKMVEKVKKVAKKMKKRKSQAVSFNFSALHLVNNPQGFAERLFKQLESSNERFEVKLMTIDVVSRLIGLHNLFLFNFYPYVARLLTPHQREVTRILQFSAQAAHELVPAEIIDPIMKAIANNFITERNSTDVMAIGLNAVREICARCPLAINEDLLRDLVQYKNYKEKSVMMAARSLIQLYRNNMPTLLHKKDRGRPTEAQSELKMKKYGEVIAEDFIPGAEVLLKESNKKKSEKKADSDSEWVDVSNDGSDVSISESESEEEIQESNKEVIAEKKKQQKEVAKEMLLTKILDDDDFKRIDREQIKKQVGVKRKIDPEEEDEGNTELVNLADIENIYKKRKHDRAARMETVMKGKEDQEKFGFKDRRKNIHCSKTNREKRKTKNYQMVKHKARTKVKRSFKDKQLALKNYLIKQKKMR